MTATGVLRKMRAMAPMNPVPSRLLGFAMFVVLIAAVVALFVRDQDGAAVALMGFGGPFLTGVLAIKGTVDQTHETVSKLTNGGPTGMEATIRRVVADVVPPMIGKALATAAVDQEKREAQAARVGQRRASDLPSKARR